MHTEEHIVTLSDCERFQESLQEINQLHGNVVEVQLLPGSEEMQSAQGVCLQLKGDPAHIQELLWHDQKKKWIHEIPFTVERCPFCKRDFLLVAVKLSEATEVPQRIHCPYNKHEIEERNTKDAHWISVEYRYKRYILSLKHLAEGGAPQDEHT